MDDISIKSNVTKIADDLERDMDNAMAQFQNEKIKDNNTTYNIQKIIHEAVQPTPHILNKKES